MATQIRGIFDSHAHYFDRRFEAETGGADAILSQIIPDPVAQIVNVGTNPENSAEAVKQAARYAGMFAAVGIHPEDCHYLPDEQLAMDRLQALLGTPESRRRDKIVALGEIGLDYHYENYGKIPLDRAKELRFFEAQLDLAEALNLPVIIHDREAHGDCFETVLRHPNVRGVFHSYSGSAEMAHELVRRGWYLSFSGTLTFKNAARVRAVAEAVPFERILVETDAPYLAPHPMRGSLNHSGLLIYTLGALAEVKGCSAEIAAQKTAKNAEELFRIADFV